MGNNIANPPRRPNFQFEGWFREQYPDVDRMVYAEARAALDEMVEILWLGTLCEPLRYIDCCQGFVVGYMRGALKHKAIRS